MYCYNMERWGIGINSMVSERNLKNEIDEAPPRTGVLSNPPDSLLYK